MEETHQLDFEGRSRRSSGFQDVPFRGLSKDTKHPRRKKSISSHFYPGQEF